MRRINGKKHITVDGKNQFVEKTSITPEWLNDVQEELCNLIESEFPLGESRTQVKESVELKIKNLKEDTSKLIDEINQQLKFCTAPIGSIIQAFLTEEQFIAQGYTGWTLCDGKNVEGSNYSKIGLGSHVPDCTGMFLRTHHDKWTKLGKSYPDSTASNTLKNLGSTAENSLQYLEHDGFEETEISLCKISPDTKRIKILKLKDDTRYSSYHSHTLPYGTIRIEGATETAPVHIIVNTFIKIN